MRRWMLFAALAACAVVDGPAIVAQGKPATGIDPCVLVTKQEAAAAVGEAVGEGKSTVVDTKGNPGLQAGGSCVYNPREKEEPYEDQQCAGRRKVR